MYTQRRPHFFRMTCSALQSWDPSQQNQSSSLRCAFFFSLGIFCCFPYVRIFLPDKQGFCLGNAKLHCKSSKFCWLFLENQIFGTRKCEGSGRVIHIPNGVEASTRTAPSSESSWPPTPADLRALVRPGPGGERLGEHRYLSDRKADM